LAILIYTDAENKKKQVLALHKTRENGTNSYQHKYNL